jgi:hypothetical protein
MPRPSARLLAAAVVLGAATLGLYATQAGAAPGPTTTPTAGPPTIDISPQPPTAPTDLRITAVTSTSVSLAWTAARGGCCGVAGYDLTYTQAFNDVIFTQALGDVTTVTLTGNIRPTGQYSIRVNARDDVGHRSASSNTVTVVTPATDTAADRTPPAAPTGLRLVVSGPDANYLAWTGSTDDVAVTGYDVYRFDGLYISTLLATVPGTTYAARPVGTRDALYVRARDAAGNLSASSNIVTVVNNPSTPPTSPSPTPTSRVTYKTGSQWSGGFVADVTVTNTGTTAVDGWALAFTFGGDQRITNAWNATFTQTGADATLTGATWNRAIPPGGTVQAGLMGTWRASAAPPTTATLNGAPCTIA